MTRRHDEQGVVLVLTALLMVAMLITVAIVIDFGQLRSDKQKNKRLADSAVAASVQDIQSGPWRAVCTAYQYVLANLEDFSSFDSESWTSLGASPTTYSSTPGACPSTAPYATICSESDESTWASFRGTARGGDVIVDITSGYRLPDSRFTEDSAISGDDGQPCDQVAVIVRERRESFFGGAAGVDEQATRIRSVGRIVPGFQQVAALIVLEQTACRAIDASTNGGKLIVHSKDDTPGSINVDSDGSGCSGGQKVVEGSPLPSTGGPNVIAESTTGTPRKLGRISIYALNTNQTSAHTEACPPSASPPATCSITPIPIRPADRLGRSLLDERYRSAVVSAVSTADSTIQSMPGTYTRLTTIAGVSVSGGAGNPNCDVSGAVTVTAPNVYIDCDLVVQSTGTLRFTAVGSTIVAKGTIGVGSSASSIGTFAVERPSAVYVAGQTSGSGLAINVSGSFIINDGGAGTCPTPTNGNPTSKLVVRNGRMTVNGGANAKLRLCQTAVIMGDGWSAAGGGPPAAWPSSDGEAPFDNTFKGNITVGGQGAIDWTAPNAVTDAPADATDWARLEDLTLWTEASAESTIGGQGTVHLAGVFALPNANPFTLGGTGSQNINADAQFWTRRLRLAGQALLEMAPNPEDSIPTIDFVLVR